MITFSVFVLLLGENIIKVLNIYFYFKKFVKIN